MDSVGRRRSQRPKRYQEFQDVNTVLHKRVKRFTETGKKEKTNIWTDVLFDGTYFKCSRCESDRYNFAVHHKPSSQKRIRVVHPKSITDSTTNEVSYICTTCEKELTSKTKLHAVSNSDDQESQQAVQKLRNLLKSSEFSQHSAELMICPGVKNKHKICLCSYKYLITNNELNSCRVEELASLHQRAKTTKSKPRKSKCGLGSGRKVNEHFEKFVLHQRTIFKNQNGLCEQMCKKLLIYSNDFIHRPLASEKMRQRSYKLRNEMIPILKLTKQNCCKNRCVCLVRTHQNLITGWRDMSLKSTRALNQAIAEMLVPTAGSRTNCYTFIRMVTGCSSATIANMVDKMRRNGGIVGPQQHGMKEYWRKKKNITSNNNSKTTSNRKKSAVANDTPSNIVLEEENINMKKIITEQKSELSRLQTELNQFKAYVQYQQHIVNTSTSAYKNNWNQDTNNDTRCSTPSHQPPYHTVPSQIPTRQSTQYNPAETYTLSNFTDNSSFTNNRTASINEQQEYLTIPSEQHSIILPTQRSSTDEHNSATKRHMFARTSNSSTIDVTETQLQYRLNLSGNPETRFYKNCSGLTFRPLQ